MAQEDVDRYLDATHGMQTGVAHWMEIDPSETTPKHLRVGVSTLEIITDVLVAHQRKDIGSCICGWSELGKSFPEHQAKMILADLGSRIAIVSGSSGMVYREDGLYDQLR